ncbi:MAG: hypothetical protein N2510_07485 [Ignavibacteria bacterium]|nr:hypothetical protein [Ignavibacteria bacterium]
MEDFKLIAIKCKSCDSGLTVEMNDTIVYCSSCGNGWEIINDELHPIEVGFAKPVLQGQGEIVYKGFWLVDSYVRINSRDSSGGWMSSFFGDGSKTEGNILFYVPAFWMTIDSVKNIGSQFTLRNPVPSPQKYSVKVTGFTFSKDDAKKIAEFIFLSAEAEKKDTVRNINYELTVNSYRVLGVPFYKQPNGKLRDAVLGIEVA